MMRSLAAPADGNRAPLRIAVAAAAPAGFAEGAAFCLPVFTVVTGGAGATIPIVVFLPVFLVAFTSAVAFATRYRASSWVAPSIAVAAITAGVLLARGGAQREVFTVLLFLLVGVRAVALAFRDWREPIAASFLVGAIALAVESVVGVAAPQDWGPPLVVLMPVFFVGSLVSRAVSIWMTDDAEELPQPERVRWLRRAARSTLWIPAAMAVTVVLGLRDGVLDHLGSLLAPIGNAVVSVLVFAFAQLSRPIFWLVDKLGIDPEDARSAIARAQRSAARASDRAVDQVGQASLVGRILGLGLFVAVVWGLLRFMRRLRPESVGSERPAVRPAAAVTIDAIADDPVAPTRVGRRAPPDEQVRRWYGAALAALARRGVDKDGALTPGEFVPEVSAAYPMSADVFRSLTRAYEDVRYGRLQLDRSALARLDADVRTLLESIRRQPPRSTDA